MISKETTSSAEDACPTIAELAARLGVELAPERQERLARECDLIRAGFLARTEMFRHLDSRNTTEHIAINSAMVEVLTAVYLGGCGAQGKSAAIGAVVVPEELWPTTAVLERLRAGAPSNPITKVFATGAQQIQAGALAGSPAVVILREHDSSEAFTVAATEAARRDLSSLTCVINAGSATELERAEISLAWRGFGWHVDEVSTGHSFGALMDALDPQSGTKPRAIIVSTCYGKALPFEGARPSADIRLPLDSLKVIIEEREGIQELAGESIEESVERLVRGSA